MADSICGIYKITSPTSKIYIGQSTNINDRWARYRGLRCKTQTIIYNSLKKHGVDNHVFEVVATCEESKLNELEKYYIDLFQTFNSKHGMNARDGGGSRARHSDETKRKMSIASMGFRPTSEQIEKHRQIMTGRKASEETKLKMSMAHKGRIVTEETRNKIGSANKGKKYSEEILKKLSEQRKGRLRIKNRSNKNEEVV